MEKYSGNQKGFIYVSCDEKDREEVFGKYLEPLAAEGVSFCWSDSIDKKEEDNIARSHAVLLFLTKDWLQDGRLRDTVAEAVKHDRPILSVRLDDAELDAGLSMQLESQQALFRNRYADDGEFLEALKGAAIFDMVQTTEQQKKKQKSRGVIAVAAALAAVLVLALVLRPHMGQGKANEDTMKALGLSGLSKSELESITSLCIVGDELIEEGAVFYTTHYTDGNRSEISYFDGTKETTTAAGSISDLSGLEQLTNARQIQLEGEQIEDASPLFGLEKLHTLSLNCNPVSTLDGIEKMSKLQRLSITDTNVSELPDGLHVKVLNAENTPLRKVPDFGGLRDVELIAYGSGLQDYSNLSTAESYRNIGINVADGKSAEILGSLKGKRVSNFYAPGLEINSPDDLSGISNILALHIQNSTISSLEGIEKLDKLRELKLTNCSGLTDLSELNGCGSLETVYISEDMAGLAPAVDERIAVVIEKGDTAGELRSRIEQYLSDNWDGGYGVESGIGSNTISVTVWREQSVTEDTEAVTEELQKTADGISDLMKENPAASHLELRYVERGEDGKETQLLVIKDGEITYNAAE